MKALGLVVSDNEIFENYILKTYFLTLWPTNATNQNRLKVGDRSGIIPVEFGHISSLGEEVV